MLLLDPSTPGNDPFCYFTIESNGWLELRMGLAKDAEKRAEYTRIRLKLNKRSSLLHGRARTTRRFLDLVAQFHEAEGDPDFAPPRGRSFRIIFAEILAPTEPYLAGVRQILREDAALRADLLASMPELGPLLERWDLPPDDCTAIRAPPPLP